ncbi:MAG: Asp-tRNA(Asn)/Glu-tRNA(Gln) amidotransferase subunit GatA [Bacteroidota bacterium]
MLAHPKQPTCTKIVEDYLTRIEQSKHLNAFVHVYAAEAKARAAEIQHKIEAGKAGPLAGLVVGLKDLICYQDHPIQAASQILAGFISHFSATATQRLLDADAIIIGHQNCDEFGMGSSNENSIWGPAYNPVDTTRSPGGSSGGSAAAVRADLCQVSLGTDTGGSVRQPAAFCGIIGLKPTYGRISRHGLIAHASSLDTIGIMANCIADCAAVLNVIAGPDDVDSTLAHAPVPTYTAGLGFHQRAKVAYLAETMAYEGLQEDIRSHTWKMIDQMRQEKHQVAEVNFPWLTYALPTYYTLSNAEASSNLARFDGVRYGHRDAEATTLDAMYKKTRSAGFGPEVQRRILLGTFVLSAAHYTSCYVKAQRVGQLIRQKLMEILSVHDFIILPTTPTTAFRIGERIQDPMAMYWGDVYTTLASIAGLPAISIPSGIDQDHLPTGLQIIARPFAEDQLLSFAQYLLSMR